MNLYVVRHGQTDYNVQKLIQGASNVPVNETGKKQALMLKTEIDKLKIDLVIVSPLLRTRQTAEILIGERKVKVITDDRLVERNFGVLEGKSLDFYDASKYWNYNLNYHNDDNVEKISDLFLRTKLFLDDIKQRYFDKNILIVSHGATIRALHFNIVGFIPGENLLKFKVNNCCLLKYSI